MNVRTLFFCLGLALFRPDSNARDITTTTGETYRNIKINRIEPTGISITHSTGVAFLECPILPVEIQREAGCSLEAYNAGKVVREEQDRLLADYRARAEIEAAQHRAVSDRQIAAAMDAAERRRIESGASTSPIASRDYTTFNVERSGLSADRYSARNYAPSGGTVSVRGYTRSDGTYVQPHTRSAPHHK